MSLRCEGGYLAARRRAELGAQQKDLKITHHVAGHSPLTSLFPGRLKAISTRPPVMQSWFQEVTRPPR